jgi:hypothetical protein
VLGIDKGWFDTKEWLTLDCSDNWKIKIGSSTPGLISIYLADTEKRDYDDGFASGMPQSPPSRVSSIAELLPPFLEVAAFASIVFEI